MQTIHASAATPRSPRPAYALRGQYVTRRTLHVPEDLRLGTEPEPQPCVKMPPWYSGIAFAVIGSLLIFALCTLGRAGA